jgi:signal transduction histidine kinase
MRERLNELNGKLEIESDCHGTNLRAIVPLRVVAPSVLHEDSKCSASDGGITADGQHKSR